MCARRRTDSRAECQSSTVTTPSCRVPQSCSVLPTRHLMSPLRRSSPHGPGCNVTAALSGGTQRNALSVNVTIYLNTTKQSTFDLTKSCSTREKLIATNSFCKTNKSAHSNHEYVMHASIYAYV